MARKINVRKILEELIKKTSHNSIASSWHVSKHSVSAVAEKGIQLGILPGGPIPDIDDDDLYKLFFPEKISAEEIHEPVDFEKVHDELNRPGVTLKLLWKEYKAECICSGKNAMSYQKYCRRYSAFCRAKGFANHIEHKAGDRIEVDWSGPTMHYVSPETGRKVTVYLFVADLVCSRLAYVEPTLSMDEKNWIQCHVNMWNYYGGVSRILVCDNLLTGVQHHPREGEIILTREYERLAEHYNTAILPCQVKKPRQKNSTENSVYNAALSIIAKLRNVEFRSFNELRKAVAEKLEELNNQPFEKRIGSRRSDFEANERAALKPLPPVPYTVGTWVWNRKVQPNCHISYGKNWYSVPSKYLGQSVDLRVTTTEVQVFFKSELVKRHLLFSPGVENHYRTDPEDMPKGTGFVEWDAGRIVKWACSIGPATATVVEKILSSKAIVEQAFNSALAVLRLTHRYSKDALEKASGEALSKFTSPRYQQIKAILASDVSVSPNDKAENTVPKGMLMGAEYFRNFGGGNND